jgi:hypothetical protein
MLPGISGFYLNLYKKSAMNFFSTKTSWSNSEFIILKLCIGMAYLFIGASFHEFVLAWKIPVLMVFLITLTWSMALWVKKMKAAKKTK